MSALARIGCSGTGIRNTRWPRERRAASVRVRSRAPRRGDWEESGLPRNASASAGERSALRRCGRRFCSRSVAAPSQRWSGPPVAPACRAREVRTRRRRDTCGRRRAGVLTRWPRRVASRRVRRTRAFQKRGHALLRVVRERQPQYSDGLPRTRSSGNQRLDEFLGRRGARQRRGSQGVRHRAAAGSRNKGLEGSSKMRAERFEVPTFGPQPRRRRWSGFRTDLR
jgi:hypothetical protein